MAILYGTTGDGTTLPVLVDQFGNLLAKGIDGEPGPPGPPGVGQLPSDPYEGAILGWQDGELAWLGGSVPLPAGTYGPYTYIDSDERLDIPQDASSLVNGQQLYMSDFNGDEITIKYSTDTIQNVNGNVLTFKTDNDFDKFAVGEEVQPGVAITAIDDKVPSITVDGGSWYALPPVGDGTGDAGDGRYEPSQEWSAGWQSPIPANTLGAFNGIIGKGANSSGNTNNPVLWRSPVALTGDISVYTVSNTTLNTTIVVSVLDTNGNELGSQTLTNISNSTITKVNFTGITDCYLVKIEMTAVSTGDLASINCGIEVNGKLLVDTSVPGGQGDTGISKVLSGSGSVFLGTNGAILLRNNNKEWVDDFYVTAPEQRIAARKVASNARKRKKK